MAEPPICNLSNWDEFYPVALGYHEATHKGDDFVIDRIDTFRKFMSEDVIDYLGGFVCLHPRFYTTEGWDQWLYDVTGLINVSSSARFKPFWEEVRCQKPVLCECIKRFTDGKTSTRSFWQDLDILASDNRISTIEQRQIFWEALAENERKRLLTRCLYFDPQDGIWEKSEPVTKFAEQRLSQVMSYLIIDESIARIQKTISYLWAAALIGFITQALFAYQLIMKKNLMLWKVICFLSRKSIFFTTFFATIMVELVFLFDMFVIKALKILPEHLRELKKKHNEFLARSAA